MNKDNAKDYLPLVQGLAEGKTIQKRKWIDVNQWEWRDTDEVDFFRYKPSELRIKPEPLVIYAAMCNQAENVYLVSTDEREVSRSVDYWKGRTDGKVRKFVEELDS